MKATEPSSKQKAKWGLVHNSILLAFLGYWIFEYRNIFIVVATASFAVCMYFTWRYAKLESDSWSDGDALRSAKLYRRIGMIIFAASFFGFWFQLAVKT